jgi:hypothetical protein
MSKFLDNPTHFAADCALQNGQCRIARENILFLDGGNEPAAVDHLQRKCGNVVIIPGPPGSSQSLLYHTSCERMSDVVRQIFKDHLGDPASVPQAASEMMVGEVQRRCVAVSYADCRARVDGFRF